jgi:hypothetical protein
VVRLERVLGVKPVSPGLECSDEAVENGNIFKAAFRCRNDMHEVSETTPEKSQRWLPIAIPKKHCRFAIL